MLSRLSIKNFALIDDISIDFDHGMNVITGETGAGKSIVIDAVSLLLGERADKSSIQTGKESAQVEGLFYLENCDRLNAFLSKSGIESEADKSILLMRQITQSGRNLCRINGSSATLTMLKEVSRFLFDIHGQHEHQSLLFPEQHIRLLDSLGRDEMTKLKNDVSRLYNRWSSINYELMKLRKFENEDALRKEILKFNLDEITKADLKIGEQEVLEQERVYLQNFEKISDALRNSYSLLFSGSQNQMCSYDQISKALFYIKQVSHFDKKYEEILNELSNVYYQLQEVVTSIRNCKDTAYAHPARLEEIENRILTINLLKRKYNNTVEGILKYKESIAEQLSTLEGLEDKITELEKDHKIVQKELSKASLELSDKRKQLAVEFRFELLNQLAELGMDKSDFQVEIITGDLESLKNDSFTEAGVDKVEFLISTNPGEPLKPLAKIVSGGEVSRIMLALKTVLAKTDDIPVLIFDEADVGISGRIAQVVAEKMHEVSKIHQVICVTHLPQIAAIADAHFRVIKLIEGNSTKTNVHRLSVKERQEELANMIGTNVVTKLSLAHAKEMLDRACDFKSTILS